MNLYPWKFKSLLVEDMLKNKLYEDDGLLVLSKPYGIGQSKVTRQSPGFGRQYGVPGPGGQTLAELLPVLREVVGCGGLRLFSAPEKWNSGLTIYAKSDAVFELLEQTHRGYLTECNRSYVAVCRNVPVPPVMGRVCRATKPHQSYGPQLVRTPSKTQTKKQNMDRFYVQHETLATSLTNDSAFVKVDISSTRQNCLRVWLAYNLALPLGDHLFAPRIAYVLGRPVLQSMTRHCISLPQPFSAEFLALLGLAPSQASALPLLVHLQGRTFTNYFTRYDKLVRKKIKLPAFSGSAWAAREGQDLVLRAPVPAHVKFALGKLGLHSPSVEKMCV